MLHVKILTKTFFFCQILLFNILSTTYCSETIHKWEVYPISFQSNKEIINPYAQISADGKNDLLKVIFEGTDGEAKGKKIILTAFWDGGKNWKVNFTSPYTGSWKFTSISKIRSMNGKKGSFTVIDWTEAEKLENPTRRGMIRVMKNDNNHYFEYADATPFLWIGDTWWNWTKKDIRFETYKQLVDNRAEKGFTIGQIFIPGNAWDKKYSMLDSTYSSLDTEQIKNVERMISYANSKGITIWIHGWWGGKNLDSEIGGEKMQRWWRYLIHRFCAYNVIWVVAGEYNLNNYGGMGLDFWKNLGNMIKEEDPYDRIVSVHNTPPFWDGGKEAPQWSTASVLHRESWLDYNQSQVGHGKFANEMIPSTVSNAYHCNPAKPIVVTEPWYEFTIDKAPACDIRFGAWSAILSGAAGHTYGGGKIWSADVPESPQHLGYEPKAAGGTTLDYEGAVSIKHLVTFMKKTSWWKMEPHPELVSEYPQSFCLANPGNEYIIYFRYGGVASVNLVTTLGKNSFQYYWYNPATGVASESKIIKGSVHSEFRCPEEDSDDREVKDWVLHILKFTD